MKKNLLIILANVLLVACFYTVSSLLVPVHPGNIYFEIEIPKGATYREAVEILTEQNLIRDQTLFLALGRLTGADRRIRAGFYSLWGSMSPLEIFKTIRKGQIVEYELQVLEGDSIFEIADKFSEIGLISRSDFMELSADPAFLSYHGIESASVEGYIFPDTYYIPKGISPEDAIGMMIKRMREKYSGDLIARTIEMGMTENEVLTLASIIEKEAVVDSERSVISGVYHNRLKKNMRLQADPTSIYGVKRSGEKIRKSDLLRKTPYNTYSIDGLPPGPIASPSLKSIRAALYPADVPYLFFVSRDDMTHHFSKTAREHLEAVEYYRQVREEMRNTEEADTGEEDET